MLRHALLLLFLFSVHASEWIDMASSNQIFTAPCTRLLNAAGTIGCQASNWGTSGILYNISSQKILNDFVSSPPSVSVAPVLPWSLMTPDNLKALESTGKLAGVLVVPDQMNPPVSSYPGGPSPPPLPGFSPDVPCPNCQYGLYQNDPILSKYPWNPLGNGLIQQAYSFPIFAAWPWTGLMNLTIFAIQQALSYNMERSYATAPLFQASFSAFMYGGENTAQCLLRGQCDVVGGLSVWSTPSPTMSPSDGKPIVFVTTTQDASGFFRDLAVGLDGSVAGSIVMLAVAKSLGTLPANWPKHIIYASFNAEQWAHAGSQKFVQDISVPGGVQCLSTTSGFCPLTGAACTTPCYSSLDFTNISFNNIEAIVELGQMGGIGLGPGASQNYYLHVDDATNPGNQALMTRLSSAASGSLVKLQPANQNAGKSGPRLPPSTSEAFLQVKRSIPAVVISDFQDKFTNPYFNDAYDDFATFNQSGMAESRIAQLCSVATTTAKMLYNYGQNLAPDSPVPENIRANCTLIATLVDCLTRNISCSLVQSIIPSIGSNKGQVSHYSGVFYYDKPTTLDYIYYAQLVDSTASFRGAACNTSEQCATLYPNTPWLSCLSNQCVTGLTRFHYAYGTGLEYSNSAGAWQVVNASKGTWTESVWKLTDVQISLASSTGYQVGELITGLVILGGSIGGYYGVKSYVKKKKSE